MSEYTLPPSSSLGSLPRDQQDEALGHLFEPCSTLNQIIVDQVLPKQQFGSYKELIEGVREELLSILKVNEEDERVSKIIAAHPRLGAPKNVKLSAHSEAEQAKLQEGSQETAEKLKKLNTEYEEAFPGLRYVVFVNGRSRPEIMENMIERINKKDISAERKEAFNAMCDIALDRASKIPQAKL